MVKKHSKLKLVLLITSVIVLMLLTIFLVGRSFAFFQYAKKGEVVNVITIKGLTVTVDETTNNALNLVNVYPVYDEDGLKSNPFVFTITNNSNNNIDYAVKLLNDEDKQNTCYTDDSETELCTELPYQYIKYSYSINDGAYSQPQNLSSDSSIYSELIKPNANTKISIKLWIDSLAPNSIQGNTFFGKLILSGEKSNNAIVTLNPNEGELTNTNLLIEKGQAIGNLPEPTKTDYIFDGWYLEDTFNTKVTSEYIVENNMTLYAKWDNDIGRINLTNITADDVTPMSSSGYSEGGTVSYNPLSISSSSTVNGMGAGYGPITNELYDLSTYHYLHITGEFYGEFIVYLMNNSNGKVASVYTNHGPNGVNCHSFSNYSIDEYINLSSYTGNYKIQLTTNSCNPGIYSTATITKLELLAEMPINN